MAERFDPFLEQLRDAAVYHQMVYVAGMESRNDIDAARRRGWATRLRAIADKLRGSEATDALALADDIEGAGR